MFDALILKDLFMSLFRACAESLQPKRQPPRGDGSADQNIDEWLENLHGSFHGLRQRGIDEELFNVISGFEALTGPGRHARRW